jgi:hypothetical protein
VLDRGLLSQLVPARSVANGPRTFSQRLAAFRMRGERRGAGNIARVPVFALSLGAFVHWLKTQSARSRRPYAQNVNRRPTWALTHFGDDAQPRLVAPEHDLVEMILEFSMKRPVPKYGMLERRQLSAILRISLN